MEKIDPAQIKLLVLAGLRMAKPLTALTKTTVDDKAVAGMESFVNSPLFDVLMPVVLQLFESKPELANASPEVVASEFSTAFAAARAAA